MKDEIKKICDEFADKKNFSGVCLVKMGDDTLFLKAYGLAHKGFKISNNIDTKFDTASVTKTFTAVSILLLIEKGLLNFDDKITDIIDLKGTEIPEDVTIYNLLTHTSGIADDADEEAGENYSDLFINKPNYSIRNTKDFIPQFAYKKPIFKAGSDVRYNNSAFILLGLAIEKTTGQDYRSFVEDNIFKPCSMLNTKFCAMDEVNENTAEGYYGCYDKNNNLIKWNKNIYSYPPIGSPDSGAYTTVNDLDKFIRNLKRYKILNEEYTDLIFSPHCKAAKPFRKWKPVPDAEIRNGYAFEFVEIDGKVFCMRKDGVNNGAGAMLSYYPAIDAAVIILCNQDCNIWQMHREIQTILYYNFYK
ncbi:MAG: beta-lactamase family protein [Bacillota bacterium]|nr:beta-lactamase family protein [Bacillota bacterium]